MALQDLGCFFEGFRGHLESFAGQSGVLWLWRRPKARILRMSEAIIWILDAPDEIFGQHILDFGGLRGASG